MTTTDTDAVYDAIDRQRYEVHLQAECQPQQWVQDEDRGVELIVRDIEQMDEGEAS